MSSEKKAGEYRVLFRLDSFATFDALQEAARDEKSEWGRLNREVTEFLDLPEVRTPVMLYLLDVKSRAISAPMPRLAPVTTHIFPARENMVAPSGSVGLGLLSRVRSWSTN